MLQSDHKRTFSTYQQLHQDYSFLLDVRKAGLSKGKLCCETLSQILGQIFYGVHPLVNIIEYKSRRHQKRSVIESAHKNVKQKVVLFSKKKRLCVSHPVTGVCPSQICCCIYENESVNQKIAMNDLGNILCIHHYPRLYSLLYRNEIVPFVDWMTFAGLHWRASTASPHSPSQSSQTLPPLRLTSWWSSVQMFSMSEISQAFRTDSKLTIP